MKKYFRINNQNARGFCENTDTSIVSVEIIENQIIIETLRGINITIGGLYEIIKQFPLEFKKSFADVKAMAEIGYKKNVKEGMSGCRTFSISYIKDMVDLKIPYRRTEKVFNETCLGKLECGHYEGRIASLLFFLPEIREKENSDIEISELQPIDVSEYTSDISDILDAISNVSDVKFTYIKGEHDSGEAYTWTVPEGVKVKTGDKALVETCYGDSEVKVVEVFESDEYLNHKEVKKIIK